MIKPLKKQDMMQQLDTIFHLLFSFCIDMDLSIQTHITCIVHNLDTLGVA